MADYDILINEEAETDQVVMIRFINIDSKELCYYMSLDELERMRFEIDDLIKTLKK